MTDPLESACSSRNLSFTVAVAGLESHVFEENAPSLSIRPSADAIMGSSMVNPKVEQQEPLSSLSASLSLSTGKEEPTDTVKMAMESEHRVESGCNSRTSLPVESASTITQIATFPSTKDVSMNNVALYSDTPSAFASVSRVPIITESIPTTTVPFHRNVPLSYAAELPVATTIVDSTPVVSLPINDLSSINPVPTVPVVEGEYSPILKPSLLAPSLIPSLSSPMLNPSSQFATQMPMTYGFGMPYYPPSSFGPMNSLGMMFMPYGGSPFPSSSHNVNVPMMNTDHQSNQATTTCSPSNVFMTSPGTRDQETPPSMPMMMPVPMMVPSFHLMPSSIDYHGLAMPMGHFPNMFGAPSFPQMTSSAPANSAIHASPLVKTRKRKTEDDDDEEDAGFDAFRPLPCYRCATCKKPFPSKSKLDRHQTVHTNERPFACPLCPLRYTQNSSLDVHLRTIHDAEEVIRAKTLIRNERMKAKYGEHLKGTKHDDENAGENL